MTAVRVSPADEVVRGALTRAIAARGHAPTNVELAAELGVGVEVLEQSLRTLHSAHALLLHPHTCRPWVVHPFALSAGSCWVQTAERGYWANCLYCAFGIAAALERDAVIATRLGGEGEPVQYRVTNGCPEPSDHLFHLSTPPAAWWDNVIFACASFQPFSTEADVDGWCARHALPRGATLTIPRLWAFASDWYGGYVRQPWHRRTPAEIRVIFTRHGLTSPFWTIP